MSAFGSLALLITGAAKFLDVKRDPPDVEITRLKAQLDDLERQNRQLRCEIDLWRDAHRQISLRAIEQRPTPEAIQRDFIISRRIRRCNATKPD